MESHLIHYTSPFIDIYVILIYHYLLLTLQVSTADSLSLLFTKNRYLGGNLLPGSK